MVAPLTWNAAEPPNWPDLTPGQKLRGALRLGAAGLVTLVLLALFTPGWALKRWIWGGVRFHFAVARLWARIMLRLLGARLRQSGAPMAHPGAILANHVSWADIVPLRAATLLFFVAKAEVRRWPGIGAIAALCDTVFVERRRGAAAAQRDALRARIEDGQLLCIFPEGTSSDGLRVLPFKSSLLSALYEPGVADRVWAQPVTVNWIVPPEMPEEMFGWWGDMGFGENLWQMACRSRGTIAELVFHDPIRIADGPERKQLARIAEEAVRGGKHRR